MASTLDAKRLQFVTVLKGRPNLARGNAPGNGPIQASSPERAFQRAFCAQGRVLMIAAYVRACRFALTGLGPRFDHEPRTMSWAKLGRPFGASGPRHLYRWSFLIVDHCQGDFCITTRAMPWADLDGPLWALFCLHSRILCTRCIDQIPFWFQAGSAEICKVLFESARRLRDNDLFWASKLIGLAKK